MVEPVIPPNKEWIQNGRYYSPKLLDPLISRADPDKQLPLSPSSLSRGEFIFVRDWLERFQRNRDREASNLIHQFQPSRTKMLGQLFVDDPFPLLIFDNVITHEIKNLYGETPLEQDFRAWKEKGNWDHGMMSMERGVGRYKDRESSVLVWRNLKQAVEGWCVEEYRIQQQWFQSQLADFTFGDLTMGEMRDAIRNGDISITPSNFGGSDAAVTVSYKVHPRLLDRLKRR